MRRLRKSTSGAWTWEARERVSFGTPDGDAAVGGFGKRRPARMRSAPGLNILFSHGPERRSAPRSILAALVAVGEADYSPPGGWSRQMWRQADGAALAA